MVREDVGKGVCVLVGTTRTVELRVGVTLVASMMADGVISTVFTTVCVKFCVDFDEAGWFVFHIPQLATKTHRMPRSRRIFIFFIFCSLPAASHINKNRHKTVHPVSPHFTSSIPLPIIIGHPMKLFVNYSDAVTSPLCCQNPKGPPQP
jgi:hypothetical protein